MTAIPTGTKFVGIGASVPTPENKSSQNNAFQEVYTIDDLQESVLELTTPPTEGDVLTYTSGAPSWEAPTGGSTATTTTVNISSAQILGTGSNDVEFLPNLSTGSYYDKWEMAIELDFNSIAYNLGLDTGMYLYWGSRGVLIDKTFVQSAADNVLIIHSNDLIDLTNTPFSTIKGIDTVNSGVFLTTNSVAPITGNSPFRAIITYTTRTFGA